MKQLLILLSISLVILLSSCSDEIIDVQSTQDLSYEEMELLAKDNFNRIIENLEKNPKEVIIEYSTLDEINAIMVDYGLEPFTQDDLAQARALKTIWPCSTWQSLGDINGDGKLSGIDLALVGSWLCNASMGCNGNYNLFTGNVPVPYDNFAYMTGLLSNSQWFILNQNDRFAASAFILGNVACN